MHCVCVCCVCVCGVCVCVCVVCVWVCAASHERGDGMVGPYLSLGLKHLLTHCTASRSNPRPTLSSQACRSRIES